MPHRFNFKKMVQKNLFDWSVVEEQIKINKQPRLDWNKLIGMTLTKACAMFKASGLNAEQSYNILILEHPDWSHEIKRRLKIGVCARFGEMKTSQEVLSK